MSYPTPDATTIDRELREIAALCRVTARAVFGLALAGRDVVEGDPWPFGFEDEAAPAGSAGWWRYATTVLAVAHNTGLITTTTRNGCLNDAYLVALARGGVR